MHLKEAIDKLYNLAVNNGIGQYEGSYEQAFDMVIEELEKKEAIINEMAIYLADIDFDECCAEIPEPCLGCSWEDYEPHINCIKQYFTNKVEKEGIKDEQSR